MHFENLIHNMRDTNENKLIKILQRYELKIHNLQREIQNNENLGTRDEKRQQHLIQVEKLKQKYILIQGELQQQSALLQQQIEDKRQQLHKGLTPTKIQQFHQFLADETLVGDQCGVCLGDIEVGRRMMRLDCDGQHVFCQVCVEGWFADHNTCPNCRHIFV